MSTRALVLGGGGVTGIAWELGVVAGLVDAGVEVRDADLIVGTSAGATVAAQITGSPLDALVAAQRSATTGEIAAELDMDLMIDIFTVLGDRSLPAAERRAAVGAKALGAVTVSEPVRRAVIEARLPSHDWPGQAVTLTGVDADTGELRLFDRDSGVDLVDAVAASCAVPGVWPPVTIGDRRYVDGGVRSSANADLASAHDRVLVLTPMASSMALGLDGQVERLRAGGADVVVIAADEAALARIGDNVLDPTRRAPALEEGQRQGQQAAPAARALWNEG